MDEIKMSMCPNCNERPSKYFEPGALCRECAAGGLLQPITAAETERNRAVRAAKKELADMVARLGELADRAMPTMDERPFRILTPREWKAWNK
jgi:hypothetical protein